MPRSRDRHGRGIRGPLALPHAWSKHPVPLSRPSRTDFFNECVTDAMSAIAAHNPTAFDGIILGVEEVPHFNSDWAAQRVPLSAALDAAKGQKAQIVIYQRPLEHRASNRSQLRRLVHRTIVEQLSTLKGINIAQLTDLGEEWDD